MKILLLLSAALHAHSYEICEDYFLINSFRVNSINGASVGCGVYRYGEGAFAGGPIGILNLGYSGIKADIGFGGWSTPEGPSKRYIDSTLVPVFLGFSVKASYVHKWQTEPGIRIPRGLGGFGHDTDYLGASMTLTLIAPTIEAAAYRAIGGDDDVICLSYGLGF